MGRLRTLATTRGADVLVVLAAVWSCAGIATRHDLHRPTGAPAVLEAVAAAAVVLSLLARRRFPFAAPLSVWLVSAGLSFLDGHLVTGQPSLFLAGVAAALLLGSLRDDAKAWTGLVVVFVAAAVVVDNDPDRGAGVLVFVPAEFALGWVAGRVLRERTLRTEAAEQRAAQALRERESAARVAAAEERGRIARELHDVVAHAVSVMVLQVGAVRHRLGDADPANRQALQDAEQVGRSALAEMRRLLGAMRADDEPPELVPHPGLGELEPLLDRVRAAGLDVRLQVDGDPVALSPALDLSAYRIVQEGLTNTLKHAGARQVRVAVQYGTADLRVEVRDDGRAAASGTAPGHGLVGVRERVRLYGGDMSAGRTPGGGFLLRARLPLDGPGA